MKSLKNEFCGHGLYKSHGDGAICLDFPESLNDNSGIYIKMYDVGLEIVSCYDHNKHLEYIIGVDII